MLNAIWSFFKLLSKRLWLDLKLYWPIMTGVILMELWLDWPTDVIAVVIALLAYFKATDLEMKHSRGVTGRDSA